MILKIVSFLVLILILWGIKAVLTSIQWVGPGPYLAICAGIIAVIYLISVSVDRANRRSRP